MGRSRQLVSHRWGKTLGTFLALAIIVIIASLIVSAITAPLGNVLGPIVNGILSAFYQPLFPILLAVYYYSNLARTAQTPPGQMQMAPTATFQAGMKLCPTCGTQNASTATFCTKCGGRLN
jgi:ribosomal protein L40E